MGDEDKAHALLMNPPLNKREKEEERLRKEQEEKEMNAQIEKVKDIPIDKFIQ